MEKLADVVETKEMGDMTFAPDEIMATDEMPLNDLVIVEEPPGPSKDPDDYEKTQNLGNFMAWITKKMDGLPPHSGQTTAGCERVIAHLKMLDKEISKAISRDVDCELDDQAVEKFRKEIRKMVKKLDKRHKEISDAYDADDDKYASNTVEFSKNAQSMTDCACHINKSATEENIVDEEPKTRYECPGCNGDGKCTICAGHGWVTDDDKMAMDFYSEDAKLDPSRKPKPYDPSKYPAHHWDSMPNSLRNTSANVCPKCNINLWKAAEGLYECISCEAVYEGPITKEAGTPKVQLIMSPFERAICGIIANGVVSQGKNAEQIYNELKKQYKFSDRDELSIQQLLTDLGYPVARNFMGAVDKNIEFSINYQA